jgi:hypothetical protein
VFGGDGYWGTSECGECFCPGYRDLVDDDCDASEHVRPVLVCESRFDVRLTAAGKLTITILGRWTVVIPFAQVFTASGPPLHLMLTLLTQDVTAKLIPIPS